MAAEDEFLHKAMAEYRAGRMDAAAKLVRKSIQANPGDARAHHLQGLVALERDRCDEAAKSFLRAIKLEPNAGAHHANLGTAYRRQGRSSDARQAFLDTIRCDPSNVVANLGLAVIDLRQGHWEEGYQRYDWRWRQPKPDSAWRPFGNRLWTAGEPLPRRLLVWGEQGIGDEILWMSCLPALRSAGVSLVVECDPRLAGIAARSFPWASVVARRDPPAVDEATVDAHIPAASVLHRCLAAGMEWKPPQGYLQPDPQRLGAMTARLEELGDGPFIGLSWRSKNPHSGQAKSLDLHQWQAVLKCGGTFLNLQYGNTDTEIAEVAAKMGVKVHTLPDLDRFNDIDGLLALVCALDLVVTTSNVTAHLAGAAGRPCFLMLNNNPLWYWGETTNATPFYPSIRAYRQGAAGIWRGVVQAVARDCRAFAEAWSLAEEMPRE